MQIGVNWLSMINYQPLSEDLQKRVASIIEAKGGKSQAARLLDVCRQTIKAAAKGLPVHPYVATKLAEKIAERDREGRRP